MIAAQSRADDHGVQVREQGDDLGHDGAAGGCGRESRFVHDRVHHQVWGVGFDHVRCGRRADYVREIAAQAGGGHGGEVGCAGVAVRGGGC